MFMYGKLFCSYSYGYICLKLKRNSIQKKITRIGIVFVWVWFVFAMFKVERKSPWAND